MRVILKEIWGLFVDDGIFAMAIVGWLVLMWILNRLQPGYERWYGLLLFAGLAVILLESATRYARRRR